MARPQWKTQFANKDASGVDIAIALDNSFSMKTPDFYIDGFQVQRTKAARENLKSFIKSRPNDRMSLFSFSGRPYLESNATLQHDFLLQKLSNIKPGPEFAQGTAIGSAISAAAVSIGRIKDSKTRIIVLISDGNSNSGSISPLQAAESCKEAGIKIYTVAIGTEGGRLPSNTFAYPEKEFDTATLKQIAKVTGGQFYLAKSTDDLSNCFDSIDRLEKTDRTVRVIDQAEEYHPWFTGAAMFFTLAYIILQAINLPPAPE